MASPMVRYLYLWLILCGSIGNLCAQKVNRDFQNSEIQDTINYTNEYADFLHKIEALKQTKLKRTEITQPEEVIQKADGQRKEPSQESKKYYVPTDAVNEYILLFDKLKCTREDATIQCYYRDTDMGGEPYLIASPLSVDSLKQAGILTYRWIDENSASLFMIPAEDTPMAYFQYLVFQVYGEQFARYWHALYDSRKILLAHPDEKPAHPLDAIFRGTTINEEVYEQGKGEGILPKVSMDEKHCKVTLYEENHEYITYVTFLISREKPWMIKRSDNHVVQKPDISF